MKRSDFVAAGVAAYAASAAPVRAADPGVSVAYAGSLVTLMEKSVGPAFVQTGQGYRGEAKGSTALANLIRDGLRTPDVFISADTAAIEMLRGAAGHNTASWYITFASTRMQIAYSADSKKAADFRAAAEGAKKWYDVLQEPGVVVARTDPAQDPKGYRVLLVAQLAEKTLALPGLAAKIVGDPSTTIVPEEAALARLETGDIDGLWAYSTETAERNLPYIALPVEIDLSDPLYAEKYAQASVTIDGKKHVGAPAVYALTIPNNARNPAGALAFVEFLLGSTGKALLTKGGLTVIHAEAGGDKHAVPSQLRALIA